MPEKCLIFILLIISQFSGYSQKNQEYECYRVLKTKKEVKDFLLKRYGFVKEDFQPGDTIVDVGAGNGYVS